MGNSKTKKGMSASVWVACIIVWTILILFAVWNFMKSYETKELIAEREAEKDALSLRVDKKKEELAAPFDNDYVEYIARRDLGLGIPGEMLFFSDIEE